MRRRTTATVLLVLALLMAQPLRSQTASVSVPDTPAGKRVAAFLKAFNTGDSAAMREFHAANAAPGVLQSMSPEELSEMDRRLFSDFGKLELSRVNESAELAITVLLKAQHGEWISLSLEVESQPPHRIINMGIRPGEAPTSSSGAGTAAGMPAALESFLTDLIDKDQFSGTVIVERDGKRAFEQAYGLASKAFKAPNRIDTKFNLGSMNKMFTGVAILQLVQQGKLSLDDTVGKVIPDYPNREVASKVTVHHLLTHTSGMGSYFNERFMKASRAQFRQIEDYYPLFVDEPLQFEPGSKWSYSNSGFMLLGAIIEKASGENYFDYVKKHIHEPAGMADTDCYELDRDVENLAVGYTSSGPDMRPQTGPRRNNVFMHVLKGGPAGGGYSTAPDLIKFANALKSNKLLDAKHTELLLIGKVTPNEDTPEMKYAYGFMDARTNGGRVVGHGGGFPGINSQLDIYLDRGYTVVVMSNYDPPAAQRVARKVRELIAAN